MDKGREGWGTLKFLRAASLATKDEKRDLGTELTEKRTKENESKKSDGSRRRICRFDHGATDCGHGTGGRGVDGYFGWAAGRQSAGHDGDRANYAYRCERNWNFDGEWRLFRDCGQR